MKLDLITNKREITTGACEKCPRKDKNKTCIGCLDEAKEKTLLEVERLGNELRVQIEDNAGLNEYIEAQDQKLQQKENIIKEVRERAKKELKIAEENIKNSKQWLDVEEEQEHAKRDIHTGKVVKRDMEMFLEILDKEKV